ncbi:universal stress protein [Fulvivirga sp.]|uniref:universal stress protein n=1 Tax=Fulvivirga sp. TaxID=1931237 RepID=UPI0032EF3833
MIKRILVPTDFSECAENAIRYAARLAKDINATDLILLNAYKLPVTYGEMTISAIAEDLIEEQEHEVELEFTNQINKLPELKEVPHYYVHKNALIEDAVATMADELSIDLIVMGTKGAHGISEIVLGTNTHVITKNSKHPVLVIPQNASYRAIQDIALATDYKALNSSTVDVLKFFNRIFRSNIHLVHISDKEIITEEEIAEAKSVNQHFKNITHHFHFIINKDMEEGINSYIREKKIDMLALIPRKHGFFYSLFNKSHSKKLIYHTEIPLLAIPD